MRRAVPVDALEERLLDVEPFDDRFDDPVDGRDGGEVVVEAARADERCASGVKNGSGLSWRARGQPLARRVAGDVEQQHRDAGVGEVRGNLRAHRAGAENRHCAYASAHRLVVPLARTGRLLPLPEPADEEVHDGVGFRGERVLAPAEDPVGGHLVEGAEEQLGGERRADARGTPGAPGRRR